MLGRRNVGPLLMAGSSMALVLLPQPPGLMGGGRSGPRLALSAQCPAASRGAASRGLNDVRRAGRQGRPALFSKRLRGGSGREGAAYEGPDGATAGDGRAGQV